MHLQWLKINLILKYQRFFIKNSFCDTFIQKTTLLFLDSMLKTNFYLILFDIRLFL